MRLTNESWTDFFLWCSSNWNLTCHKWSKWFVGLFGFGLFIPKRSLINLWKCEQLQRHMKECETTNTSLKLCWIKICVKKGILSTNILFLSWLSNKFKFWLESSSIWIVAFYHPPLYPSGSLNSESLRVGSKTWGVFCLNIWVFSHVD